MTHPKPLSAITPPIARQQERPRARRWPRPPRRDPHIRLIAQLMELAGPDSSVIATSTASWASATFTGARHKVAIRLYGADHAGRAARLSALLPEAEFNLCGHLVADACVDRCTEQPFSDGKRTATAPTAETETLLQISFLTIEDW